MAMSATNLKAINILIVEDEPMLRRQLTANLEQFGADVSAADSIAVARECLRDGQFDFILLDVNLPDGLGTDLLREKAFPASSSVIVMTANGGVANAVEAMRLGAIDYLVKPFDVGELPLVLARAQKMRQSARLDEQKRDDTAKAAGMFFFRSCPGERGGAVAENSRGGHPHANPFAAGAYSRRNRHRQNNHCALALSSFSRVNLVVVLKSILTDNYYFSSN